MKRLALLGFIFIYIFKFSTIFASSDLKIISASPQGILYSIYQSDQISITFDRPVVKLGEQLEETPSWFVIEPAINGKIEWIGTSALTFHPREKLKYGTEYAIIIKSGLKAIDGSRLKTDFSFTFQTPVPVVQYSYPHTNEQSIDINTDIKIYFNIPVLPRDVEKHLQFTTDGISEKKNVVGYQIINDQDEPTQEIIIQPTNPLMIDQSYIVSLPAGLRAFEGSLGSRSGWNLIFRTYSVFKFKEVRLYRGEKKLNPKNPIILEFTNPVEYKEIKKHIKISPVVTLDDYGDSYKNTKIRIYGPFTPETDYRINISKQLSDVFGNKLQKDHTASFRTRSYDPVYKIPMGESIIEAYGDVSIPIELVNLNEIDIKTRYIPKDSIDIIGTWFRKQSVVSKKDRLGDRFEKKATLSYKISKNKLKVVPLKSEEFLGNRRYGNYIIQFYGDEEGEYIHPYKFLLVQVTDLGITAKFSPVTNGIFVTNLKDGSSADDVDVEVRDGSGRIYWKGKTDGDGYCESPGWQRLGMPATRNDEPVQWIVATKGNDVAYTYSQKGTGISPWEFNISYEWRARDEKIDGAIFTDRGIYRPDDTVHVKVVLREKYGLDWKIADRDSIKTIINDPTGKTIYEKKHTLNEFGAFDYSIPLAHDAKRGYYGIQVVLPQKMSWEKWITQSFWVEDYRPAEFEVVVKPIKKEYIFGDSIVASINGKYLFGAAMKDAPMKWAIIKSHYYHNPPDWDGYYFHPRDYREGDFSGIGSFTSQVVKGEGKLDKNGHTQLKHVAKEPNLLTSALYQIEGTVIDQNRREITGSHSVIVYRGEYQIGVKPQSFFGNSGKKFRTDIITNEHDGSLVENKEVIIKIIRRNWYSVRKAGTGGRYYWETEITDSLVAKETMVTDNKPTGFEFTPKLAGYYLLRATSIDDRGNTITSDCSFYILGSDYIAWERGDDDRIDLEKDKKEYTPGDVATILIKSPFERATALVTLEREGIVNHFYQKVSGSTPSLEIPVKESYIPNIYVSVMLIQGRVGDGMYSDRGEDVGKPAFKLGYINLVVNSKRKKLDIAIDTDKDNYKPGDTVTINVKSRDWSGAGKRSEIILAVVDKGVLNLTGYHFTDLHKYFYRNRPLSVTSSDSRLHIIGQRNYGEKGENSGGGGAEAGFSSLRMRKDFKTTAYWNPSLITDSNGDASIQFDLPDNMTTFVIMAAVHDKDSNFGSDEKSILVNQPLVLQPSLPRFIRYGDKLETGTLVHNYSETANDIRIKLELEGIELLDKSNERLIKLEAGESEEVRFNLKASKTGSARFIFKADMGEFGDLVQKEIPIYRPLTYEVVATANSRVDKVTESLQIPENIHESMSSLEVKTSSTQLIGVSDGIRYLYEYPYGCLEQKVSRILPMILFDDVVESFDIPSLDGKNYEQEVQQFFNELSDYMTASGGYSYWPETEYTNPYVSAWTVFAMIKALEKKYSINEEHLEKAINYLKGILHSRIDKNMYPYTWNYWATTNSLIMYVLALYGEPDHAYIEKMYLDREKMPYFGLAYLMKTMKLANSDPAVYQDIRRMILNGLKESPTVAYFEEPNAKGLEWCFHSNVRTTALILQAFMELGEDFPQASKIVKWLISKRKLGGAWYNTQENIYVLHALNTYFLRYEGSEPDFKLVVKLDRKRVLESNYKGYNLRQDIQLIDISNASEGEELKLKFDKRGKGRYYYETRLKYYPQDLAQAKDHGISIIKKWEIIEGDQVNDAMIPNGATVKVTLTAATPMERNYIVLDDPLPAGFEVINTRLKTVSSVYEEYKPLELSADYWGGFNYYEIKDDRVIVFADNLPRGVHTFVYLCKALTPGEYNLPATKVEEMYTPEVFGRTGEKEIIIK